MSHLRAIEGGRDRRPAVTGKIGPLVPCCVINPTIGPPTDDLPERVRRAEGEARMAVQLVAPGMAIVSKSRAELVRMIATVDVAEAVQTQAIFKEAVASVDALFKMLRTAEIRLAVAINTLAREGLTEPDDD
jgi:hypothetical protein